MLQYDQQLFTVFIGNESRYCLCMSHTTGNLILFSHGPPLLMLLFKPFNNIYRMSIPIILKQQQKNTIIIIFRNREYNFAAETSLSFNF